MDIEILKKEAEEWKSDSSTYLKYWVRCKDGKVRLVRYHYPHLFYIGSDWFSCNIWKNGKEMYAGARYKNLPERLYCKELDKEIKNEHRKLYGQYYVDALKHEITIIENTLLEYEGSKWERNSNHVKRLLECKELLRLEEQLAAEKENII